MSKFVNELTILLAVAVIVVLFCCCCEGEAPAPTRIAVEQKVIEGVVCKVWAVTKADGHERYFARLVDPEQDYRISKDVMEFIEAHGLDKSYRFVEHEAMVVVEVELVE